MRIGFDISFYQDNDYTPQTPDFERMRDYGASFVIIRAGQGNWPDEDFKINWKNAKGILPRHSYWYYDNRYEPRGQARTFWNQVKDDFEGMLWLDLEHVKFGKYQGWKFWFDFLDELMKISGLGFDRIGIYTGYYYWNDHAPTVKASRDWFGQFKLWLAWYTNNISEVKVPSPWTRMFLWQDGTYPIGPLVGVESKEVDHNFFIGTEEEFTKYFGDLPEPPDTGEPMTVLYYADLKSGYTSNVRIAADLESAVVTRLVGPVTVSIVSEKTPADNYDWYQISEPSSGFIALTSSYINFRPAAPQTEEDKPIRAIIEMDSGKVYVSTNFTLQ